MFTTVDWMASGNSPADYGAVRLNCTIGDTAGWYGYSSQSHSSGDCTLVLGYPVDKPSTQWSSLDRVQVTPTRYRVYYQNDTFQGADGGPVIFGDNDWCRPRPPIPPPPRGPMVMAIHAWGLDTGGSESIASNSGVRISPQALNNLNGWK